MENVPTPLRKYCKKKKKKLKGKSHVPMDSKLSLFHDQFASIWG